MGQRCSASPVARAAISGQQAPRPGFVYDEALELRTNSAVTHAASIPAYDRFIARRSRKPSMEKDHPTPDWHAAEPENGSSEPKAEHNVLVQIPYSNASPPSMPTASRRQPKD